MTNNLQNQARYRDFCATQKKLPVYLNDWYLDYACGAENWNAVIHEVNGEILGVLPYCQYRIPLIGKKIGMPKITPCLGVFLNYPDGMRNVKRLSFEKEVTMSLIQGLPKFSYFNVRFHTEFRNWLPFYWNGFSQRTMYTYVLPDLSDLDQVYNEFKSSVRGKIRKAAKLVTVEISEDIERFYVLNKMTFDRQGISMGYDLANLKKMDRAFSSHHSRTLFIAKDAEGRDHSALYLTYDQQSAYVHLVGEDPDLRSSGAGTLLVWNAIQYTKKELKLNRFDFEGSIIEQIEENRRSYGTEQVPYHKITKVNAPLLKIGFFLNDLFKIKSL